MLMQAMQQKATVVHGDSMQRRANAESSSTAGDERLLAQNMHEQQCMDYRSCKTCHTAYSDRPRLLPREH